MNMAYSTIRKGSSNDDVKTWQEFLAGQGYSIATDGIFGDETYKYTKKWQESKGLTADGIVGANTWASMNIGNNTNTSNTSATDNNAKKIPDIFGADSSLVEEGLSSFEGSDELKGLENEKNEYKDKAQEFLSNTDIVDENTKKEMNSQLSDYLSPEIDKANAWLSSQLEKIQSGKTSYTDQMNGLMDKIMNRDPFEYDVDNDQLFQQALSSAMNSGRTAMQDTIGQASSLTGGYGSTYATNVGNQAYNQFIEDAYNNLPEYYQMALEAYQMEGQDLYNQFNMLSTADANEWSKMVQGYDATMQYSNTLYDRGFNEWNTTVNNAINKGNFQLNEHSTIANNLMGAYDISANEYVTKYTEEWNNWNREIENVWNTIGMQNSDYWANKTYEQTESWNQKDLDYKYANLDFEKEQFNYSKGDLNNDGVVSEEEKNAMYDGYINPDDIEVDDDGNIIKIEGHTIVGADTKNGKNSPTVSGFKANTGDNFEVTIGDKTYKVENWGEEKNSEKIEGLKNAQSYGNVKIYNNKAYIVHNGKYYQIGNRAFGSGYNDLLLALGK